MAKREQSEFVSRDHPVNESILVQRRAWQLLATGYFVLFAIIIPALMSGFSDG